METCCGIRTALRVLAFCGVVGAAAGLAAAEPGTGIGNAAKNPPKISKPGDAEAKKAGALRGTGMTGPQSVKQAGGVVFTDRGSGGETCAAATAVGEGSFAFDTNGRTTDGASEALCLTFGLDQCFNDEYFLYTAGGTGTAAVSLCGSAGDTKMAIYDASGGCPGTIIACDDDFCAFAGASRAAFPVTLGQQFFVRVGNFGDGGGSSGLVNISLAGPLVNDNCGSATPIADGVNAYDSTGATTDGSPDASCLFFGSDQIFDDVWFNYVATASDISISLCGTPHDTKIALYDGGSCVGTKLGCNDDSCGLQSAMVVTGLTIGNTYKLRVGGFNAGAQGPGTIVIGPFTAPTCGDCPGAPNVTEGEPDCGIAPGCTGPDCDTVNGGCNSVPPAFSALAVGDTVCGTGAFDGAFRDTDWYQFTIATATEVAWTITAEFDVLVGFIPSDPVTPCPQGAFIAGTAITGVACSPVTTVACLPPGTYVAFVAPQFTATIPCGGGNGDYFGSLTDTGGICTASPPVNDLCANSIPIFDGVTAYDTAFAGTDGPAEPLCLFFGNDQIVGDIWYDYTSLTTGTIQVTTCGLTAHDSKIAVYDGAACLGPILACNDDACGLQTGLTFSATAGNVYKIRLGGFGGTGAGSVLIGPFTAPDCGDCTGSETVQENELDCGIAAGCTGPDCDTVNGGCNSVPPVFTDIECGDTVCGSGAFNGAFRDTDWYRFTVPPDSQVTWTVNAEFDVLVGFIDLNAGCPAGAFIAGTAVVATAAPCANISTTFCFAAGTYVAFVGPQFTAQVPCGGGFGDYTASLTCDVCDSPEPPANDDCEDAVALAFNTPTAGTTLGASADVAPLCGTAITAPGVWYTVMGNGETITLSTCDAGTNYDTKLNIYCGSCDALTCVAGLDDSACAFNGLFTTLPFCSQNGVLYHVLVQGFGGQQGNFVLTATTSGSSCTGAVQCLPSGACCTNTGCTIETEAACDTLGGDWLGANTTCTSPATEFAYAGPPVTTLDGATVSASITVPPGSGVVSNLIVRIRFSPAHTWIGDLTVTLTNGPSAVLFARVGQLGGTGFGDNSDAAGPYRFTPGASGDLWAAATTADAVTAVASGTYFTSGLGSGADTNALAVFNGMNYEGTWTLSVADGAGGDAGTLTEFALETGVIDNCDTGCPCDWNLDGVLNSTDFFDFLEDFFAGSADFNEDGVTNSTDFFDFLECFFANAC